jgi:hypothetical protein
MKNLFIITLIAIVQTWRSFASDPCIDGLTGWQIGMIFSSVSKPDDDSVIPIGLNSRTNEHHIGICAVISSITPDKDTVCSVRSSWHTYHDIGALIGSGLIIRPVASAKGECG